MVNLKLMILTLKLENVDNEVVVKIQESKTTIFKVITTDEGFVTGLFI